MWFKKSLKEALAETKKIKVQGVLFEIKRIDPLDYLDGSQAMLAVYEKYKVGKDGPVDGLDKKIRSHYKDVLMAGVVKPKLSRKEPAGENILVDEIFSYPNMAEDLYLAILEFTYGKKKFRFAL